MAMSLPRYDEHPTATDDLNPRSYGITCIVSRQVECYLQQPRIHHQCTRLVQVCIIVT